MAPTGKSLARRQLGVLSAEKQTATVSYVPRGDTVAVDVALYFQAGAAPSEARVRRVRIATSWLLT
jgi:hypothetical protein